MRILVTGGAGYIGSHTVHALIDRGYEVLVIDDLSTGSRENLPEQARLFVGDIADHQLLLSVLSREVAAILHFAGSIIVPESVENPIAYYLNNTVKSHALISAAICAGIQHFIFSSTAAVYGQATCRLVDEELLPAPISPYGTSKMMTELMLRDAAAAHDFRYVTLRYFNVAGADPIGRTGQNTRASTHLIKVACETALGRRRELTVFGTDYPTKDGTCIRDYIHVSDLAAAHVNAVEYLLAGGSSVIVNCGYGKGQSVLDVVASVKRVSGVEFPVSFAPRRAGDPVALVAAVDRIHEVLHWRPVLEDIDQIVADSLRWERTLSSLQQSSAEAGNDHRHPA